MPHRRTPACWPRTAAKAAALGCAQLTPGRAVAGLRQGRRALDAGVRPRCRRHVHGSFPAGSLVNDRIDNGSTKAHGEATAARGNFAPTSAASDTACLSTVPATSVSCGAVLGAIANGRRATPPPPTLPQGTGTLAWDRRGQRATVTTASRDLKRRLYRTML